MTTPLALVFLALGATAVARVVFGLGLVLKLALFGKAISYLCRLALPRLLALSGN